MIFRLRRSKQQPPVQAGMSTIDKQRMLRSPEYGYAHVWELQQLQGEDTVQFTTSKQVDTIPYNTAGQTRIGQDHHKYESPQFLRIDNTLGRLQCQYPEFHHDLDTQVRHSECEAHPNIVQCSVDQRYTN